MEVVTMKLNEKIIKLRKEKGWSQEDLAERLCVSRQAVSRWEQGSTLPDIPNLLMLEEVFGVSADYLIHDNIDSVSEEPIVPEKVSVSEKNILRGRNLALFCGIFWLVLSICCLINAIFYLEIMYVILSLFHVVIASLFFLSYFKNKV